MNQLKPSLNIKFSTKSKVLRRKTTEPAWTSSIIEFCQRWKVQEFYLFGSVLRDDFNEQSDIDVMIKFLPNPGWGWEVVRMDRELEKIFGRKVDIAYKDVVEQDDNWLRRKNILSTARLIYEQKQ